MKFFILSFFLVTFCSCSSSHRNRQPASFASAIVSDNSSKNQCMPNTDLESFFKSVKSSKTEDRKKELENSLVHLAFNKQALYISPDNFHEMPRPHYKIKMDFPKTSQFNLPRGVSCELVMSAPLGRITETLQVGPKKITGPLTVSQKSREVVLPARRPPRSKGFFNKGGLFHSMQKRKQHNTHPKKDAKDSLPPKGSKDTPPEKQGYIVKDYTYSLPLEKSFILKCTAQRKPIDKVELLYVIHKAYGLCLEPLKVIELDDEDSSGYPSQG